MELRVHIGPFRNPLSLQLPGNQAKARHRDGTKDLFRIVTGDI